jgi:DNA adenine methylase
VAENTSLLRYPGGKKKLLSPILSRLIQHDDSGSEYREPFFGGGAVGFQYLMECPGSRKIWINDRDPGIASLWTAVLWYPGDLKERIQGFRPSPEAFDEMKKQLRAATSQVQRRSEVVDIGFKKLAIHRISYSGLGTMAGGPLGGRNPLSLDKIRSRWNPDRLCATVDILHERLAICNVRHGGCTCLDFEQVISDNSCPSVIYLDPPYWEKGSQLYQCSFTHADHGRLADLLKVTKHSWVLSYDDCPEIRELYSWANIQVLDVNYSITAVRDGNTGKKCGTTKSELIIGKPKIGNMPTFGMLDIPALESPAAVPYV